MGSLLNLPICSYMFVELAMCYCLLLDRVEVGTHGKVWGFVRGAGRSLSARSSGVRKVFLKGWGAHAALLLGG